MHIEREARHHLLNPHPFKVIAMTRGRRVVGVVAFCIRASRVGEDLILI